MLASQAAVRQPIKHDVVVDGHHFAVWQKRGAQPVRQVAIDEVWSALRFRPR